MHRIQHGITRPFLRTVWAHLAPCLGLNLLLVEEENPVESSDLLPKIEGLDYGDLLPQLKGEEGKLSLRRGDAVNTDLQPEIKGQYIDGEGALPPSLGDEDAVNIDPQPSFIGQEDEEKGILRPAKRGVDEDSLPPMRGDKDEEHGGIFHPAVDEDDDGGLPPMLGINTANAIIQASIVSFHINGMHVLCDAYSSNIIVITYMHARIWKTRKACMVHDDVIIVHAKPRVDPKVKKKTSLLLCLSIDMPFHPGEHGHDGTPPSRHHEPCSSPCLYIERSYPSVHHSPHPTSSSDFSLLIHLSNEDKHGYEVLKVATASIELPFIPLRGSKRCQARERQFQLKMMACTGSKNSHAALKTKTMGTKMRLFYIHKDLLDPG